MISYIYFFRYKRSSFLKENDLQYPSYSKKIYPVVGSKPKKAIKKDDNDSFIFPFF